MNTRDYFANWNYPTDIKFGAGRVSELVSLCDDYKIKNPLLVTDSGLVSHDIIKNIINLFNTNNKNIAIFSNIQANPIDKNILDGVSSYKKGSHDGVIAVGGGSALDCGKVINFMAAQELPLWSFIDENNNYLRANTNRITPIIAVPTTSGTGAEVGRCALIIDPAAQQKKFIFHPRLMPNCVVADPCLTLGLTEKMTAATAMDTFTHNFEAYCAKGYHPIADGIALEAMRMIKRWLPVAIKKKSNLEARTQLMATSIMGGAAFQKGLGAIHSLSHPVGAIYNKHHGLLNAIFLPYVLDFHRDILAEKMERLAQYLNLPQQNVNGVLSWILSLLESIDIPLCLNDIGINDNQADLIVKQALSDPSSATNPINLTDTDFSTIFKNAVYGTLM